MTRQLYAVIPAGGSGTRLWPASRVDRPKFLLPLPGPRSMLQSTLDRLAGLVATENIYVVTGAAHAVAVSRQLSEIPEEQIIVEPAARGTGPAIGLGTALIACRDPDAVMGSFAADHYVARPDVFRRAVTVAAEAAEQGYLVTIGITPTHPETGYGYIRRGAPLFERDEFQVQRVEEFREKPDAATAEEFVRGGRYLWNASMFVWRAATLLDTMRELLPGVYDILTEIAAHWDGPHRSEVLERLWPQIDEVTIDHGIMERARNVAVVPADIGWTDLGDWHSLAEVLTDRSGDNVTLGGQHIAEDTRSTLVISSGRAVATLGVENLVIVETDDVVMVCHRSRAQDVRRLVQRVRDSGLAALI